MQQFLAVFCLLIVLPFSAASDPAVGRVNTAGFNSLAMCSGTLVRPGVVLSAAHCVSRMDGTLRRPTEITFVAGWNGEDHAGAAKVARIEMHPNAYASGRLDARFDVAVLWLQETLDVAPIPVGVGTNGTFALAGYKRTRPHRLHMADDCVGWPERGMLWLDCPVEQGLSGGPVLKGNDASRRLVAVVVAKVASGALAVPVGDWLRVTLNRPYTPQPD